MFQLLIIKCSVISRSSNLIVFQKEHNNFKTLVGNYADKFLSVHFALN